MSLAHQWVPNTGCTPVTRVTPVTGNSVTDVTSELLHRVTLLEARVALLEGRKAKPEGKKSRADYMRERRKRQKEPHT